MQRISIMAKRQGDMEHRLRDYPISLRESARAVFGDRYESAERHADAAMAHDHVRAGSDPLPRTGR